MEERKFPANILLVDDDPAVLSVISLTLREAGYRVVTAPDGKEALVKIFTDPSWGEKSFPDLILSDVMMPVMNGYEFCEKVKKNPATRGIPFIFLTAKSGVEDRARGLFLGCQAYLPKPCRRKELLRAVNERLVDAAQTKALLADADPIMEGDLSRVSILSLVDMFLAGGWSGRISLSRSAEVGSLEFNHGELTRASLGEQEDLEALKTILGFKEGSFKLERKPQELGR